VRWITTASIAAPDEVSDKSVPTGITVTGSVVFVPDPKSVASFWSNAGQLMVIQTTIGSIVDLSVDWTLDAFISPDTLSIATGVLGSAYFLALDGPSGNTYTPIGLPTTH
jgi:hypothetical protein